MQRQSWCDAGLKIELDEMDPNLDQSVFHNNNVRELGISVI